jgi:hypothetical protein
MTCRIITAREQVEMLTPWRRIAAVSYHLTADPDFELDPAKEPQEAQFWGQQATRPPGVFLTSNPDIWHGMYGYHRPYVAEIEHPDDIMSRAGVSHHRGGEGAGPQTYIPAEHMGDLRVNRVMPYDAYSREQYNWGPVESASGKDFQTGAPLPISSGQMSPAKWKQMWGGDYRFNDDVRNWKPAQRKNWEKQYSKYLKQEYDE